MRVQNYIPNDDTAFNEFFPIAFLSVQYNLVCILRLYIILYMMLMFSYSFKTLIHPSAINDINKKS
jgi:hypothetical protein